MYLIRALFLILFLATAYNAVQAQIPLNIRVFGEIYSRKGEPLAYSNIYQVNTGEGTTSDQSGRFSIRVSVRETILRFSFVGYKPYYQKITAQELMTAPNGEYYIRVVLEEEARVLDAVRIIGRKPEEKPEKLAEEPHVSVTDFDFHDNRLVLLTVKSGKQRLQFRTLEDSLVYEAGFKKKISSFYRDCIGNLHLVCADSVYQVFPLPWAFYFYTGTSKSKFEQIVEPCIATGNGNYIFERFTGHNQMKSYYTIHRDSLVMKPLHFIYDQMAFLYANDYADLIMNRMNSNAFNSSMTAYNSGGGRGGFDRKAFYDKILTRPVYGPLVRVDTTVFIFDHLRDTCYNFGVGGRLIGSVPFGFHKKLKWERNIFTDSDHLRVFGIYQQNGVYQIGEINPKTGGISNTYKVKEHLFPEKMKVKGDEIYYLKIGTGRKYLYRQYLGLLESD